MRKLFIHGGLFVATLASMTYAFGFGDEQLPLAERLVTGLFFSVPAILILGAHEMGHYLMARAHGVDSSWPYFIPLPLGFGTLGAVIQLKGKIPSRNALFDIGVAGPLAGLAIAVPMLLVGVMYSHPVHSPLPPFPPTYSLLHQASELGMAIRHFIDGVEAPAGAQVQGTYFGDNLLSLLATRVVWGKLPAGMDLDAHPVFVAAWFGMLVTTLNLMPAGQLDGGHVMRSFFGPKAEQLGHHVASALIILAAVASASWLLWFFIISRVVGFGHPPPTDDLTPLSRGRRLTAYATWLITVLVFIPVPMDVLTVS